LQCPTFEAIAETLSVPVGNGIAADSLRASGDDGRYPAEPGIYLYS